MIVFYVEPAKVTSHSFELTGQEAQHATEVLRLRRGDEIHATDGAGKRFTGKVDAVGKQSVTAIISQTEEKPEPEPKLVLALGIIKKRDRLEFAVEKAVELGASEIVLFTSDHSEKTKVRLDRLENIAVSAMKQSLRFWLPKITIKASLDDVIEAFYDSEILMAHERISNSEQGTSNIEQRTSNSEHRSNLLLVGPEGGFSDREVEVVQQKNGALISLGEYRLRAETAAAAFLSRYTTI